MVTKVYTVNGEWVATFENRSDALMFIKATERPNDYYYE